MDPSASHLHPWRRWPYVVAIVGSVVVPLALIVTVTLFLIRVDLGGLGALCGIPFTFIGMIPLALGRRWGFVADPRDVRGPNEEAFTAVREGRYEDAARIWDGLCHDTRRTGGLHALHVHRLGMAWLHQGHLDEGRVLIDRAYSSGWLGAFGLPDDPVSTRLGRALSLALAGELDAARQVLARLRPRLASWRRPATMLVDAVIAARSGQRVELDEEMLREAKSELMPPHVRALRLLEVFTGAPSDGGAYREGGGVAAIGARPGELDFLAAQWAELRAFMESRGLLA